MRDEPDLRFDMLHCITAVDYFEPDAKKAAKVEWQPHVEVIYHLSSMVHRHRLVLKVQSAAVEGRRRPGELPEVPSVSGVWSTADWHEREVFDLCGVRFLGPSRPAADPLPGGLGRAIRLRKDYQMPAEYHGIPGEVDAMATERVRSRDWSSSTSARTRCSINMGPQHPSTHGVLRLVLRTDGEVVTEVTPHIGYLHRCAEKIGENLTPRQFMPYTDRLDYLAGMNMNLGWALCVEKLLGCEVPEKARHLRV